MAPSNTKLESVAVRHGLGRSDLGKRAAAIATQAQCTPRRGDRLLERRESPGQRIVRGQWRQDDAVQPRRAGDSRPDRELAGIEPHHQERRLLPCAPRTPARPGSASLPAASRAEAMQIDL